MVFKLSQLPLFAFLIVLSILVAAPASAQYNRYPATNNQSNNSQQNPSFFNNSNQGNNNSGNTNNLSNRRSNRAVRGSRTRNSNTSQTPAGLSQPTLNTSDQTGRRNPAIPGSPSISPSGAGAGSVGGLQVQGAKKTGGLRKSVSDPLTRQNATLYLNAQSMVGVINEPVTVNVVLSNKKNLEFDRMAFLIQYDPKELLLSSGQDADGQWKKDHSIPLSMAAGTDTAKSGKTGKSFLEANLSKITITTNSVDTVNGLIQLDISMASKPLSFDGTLLSLRFVPLRESSAHVSFQFIHPEMRDPQKEPLTCLTLSGKDQLGTRFSQSDGVINLDLQIYESLEKAKNQHKISQAGQPSEDNAQEGTPISLSLVSRQSVVNVGETVDVDVVITNPDNQAFDSISLLIAYNPRVFEPVDGDDNASGLNIADQKYKDRFPFDFPVLNAIDKEKGIVDFRKKAMRKPCRSEGIIATIQLRAIRPTQKTTFRLFLSETRQEPTTGIGFRYLDRLGDPSDPFDGVTTCSLGVRATTAYLDKMNR